MLNKTLNVVNIFTTGYYEISSKTHNYLACLFVIFDFNVLLLFTNLHRKMINLFSHSIHKIGLVGVEVDESQ